MSRLHNSLCAILLFCVLHKALTTDYCDKSLCKTGKHIGCNNDGKFGKLCRPDAEIIKMTQYLREHILENNNLLRQQVALDKKAGRMAKMAWNDDLAKLAELNVRQCEAKRDECHNTNRFPNSGQNVGVDIWSNTSLDQDIVDGFTRQWYNEIDYATDADIQNYNSLKWLDGKTIEHFGLVMNQAATHIGCAMLRQTTEDGAKQQFIACNYAANVVDGKPIFRMTRRAGINCRNGHDEEFPYMCTSYEDYRILDIEDRLRW